MASPKCYDISEAGYLFLLLQDLNLSDGCCERLILEIEMGLGQLLSEKRNHCLQNQNQNQNCLLVIRPRTIIHQDLCLGKLVPSPHKRSKLSN